VDSVSFTKSRWTLSREGFTAFLACLDSDPDRAGEKYESLRLTLIKFFDWRGAYFPDECTDETINRVIRKIEGGEAIQDIPTFCHGVARLVFLEKLKSPESRTTDIDKVPAGVLIAPEPDERDPRRGCLDRCLRELQLESRQLILRYYREDKRAKIDNRQALAADLGIPLNALRSRAQRIRDRLGQCVQRCLTRE
jgi:DNA-directed RNA polymerase specialized sigma24 family protein